MSLKDWMKKVENSQLNEFAPPPGSVVVPAVQGKSDVNPTFVAATKPNDKATQGILKTLAQNKSIAVVGQQPGQTQAGTTNTSGTTTGGTTTQTVGGTTQVSETELDQVGSFHDEIKMEAKPRAGTGSSLDYIKENHPHECKMFEDGWGLDESLYGALVDHYFKEGRIPRGLILEGGQALREFVESCYAKDTGMGGTQDSINNGMLDEQGVAEGDDTSDMEERVMATLAKHKERIALLQKTDPEAAKREMEKLYGAYRLNLASERGVAEGSKEDFTMNARQADPRLDKYATDPKPSFLDKAGSAVGGAIKKAGSAVMNKLHPTDAKLRSGPLGPLDETSELEQMLRQSTKENTMYESKKSKKAVEEAVEKTKTGIRHKADAGGYGRKDDEEDGKKVAKDEPKKTRGRPKKTDNASGEDKKFDFSALSKTSASKAPKTDKWDKKKTTTHKIATKADREEIDEGQGVAEGPGFDKLADDRFHERLSQLIKKGVFGKPGTGKGKEQSWNDSMTDIARDKLHKLNPKKEQGVSEGETIEKKGGRVHKGSYGTSHEAGDEGVKKVTTQRGRGRPKKDADDSGEVKNYDWSAFGAKKGVKLPAWDKKKTTTHKIATKADREEVEEAKLKGKQGTLDVAPPKGKLTSADFKALGSKKKKVGEGKVFEESMADTHVRSSFESHLNKGLSRDQAADKVAKHWETTRQKVLDLTSDIKDAKARSSDIMNRAKKGLSGMYENGGKVESGKRIQKKKDPQMESWDAQLKNLLTEGMTVSTSVGNEGGKDSVSITANDADAHKLLQILQNAGIGGQSTPQVMSTTVQPAKSTGPATNATSPATTTTGGSATDDNIETAGGNVSSMPMPRGMAFSVQPAETEVPTAPEEISVVDNEEVISSLGKEHGQSNKSTNGDDALAFLKKAIGHGTDYATGDAKSSTTTDADTEEEVAETDEDGKKPDEDGDGVPDWADKKEGKDDSEEADDSEEEETEEADDSEEEETEEESDDEEDTEEESEEESDDEEEKVDEGKETCNECGGLMEDDHQCGGQLNEWSNSPQGQADDEQFLADIAFLTKSLAGGLNKPKVDQTVMPHTKVKIAESKVKSTESAYTLELKKLAGI